MTKNFLKELLRTNQTVFSFQDLFIKFRTNDTEGLKSKVHYYVKTGQLYHIRRGLYAKDANYNRFELANKIMVPSYISFETVLRSAGIIFQYYKTIFVASYQSREIICDGQTYMYRTIKDPILTGGTGVQILDTYSIASPERAFLDLVYIQKHYHFDNLEPLDWDKVYDILPCYGNNKAMKERVIMYHNAFKEGL